MYLQNGFSAQEKLEESCCNMHCNGKSRLCSEIEFFVDDENDHFGITYQDIYKYKLTITLAMRL